MNKQIIIKANVLFDGKTRDENKYIVVENDKIVDVISKKMPVDYEGYVTPAFIDAHSHIGMDRDGEPWQEGEANDHINQINPLINPLNSIYFDDKAFKETVDFGVLYSCIVPGSGNLLGGQAKIIRNFAQSRKNALLKDYGYKMALGFNPRSTTAWKGKRPTTRMGVYALLEKEFDKILLKKRKNSFKVEKKLYDLKKKFKQDKISQKEYNKRKENLLEENQTEFSPEELEILELLKAGKVIKVHVHKDDDVLYLIDFAKKYNLKVTADHTADVFHQSIFDELADNDIPVVYGPIGSVGYKVELKNASYKNTKLLMNSKADYGLMTDHPVIHSYTLRDCLKYFLIQGMKAEDAIALITFRNAKILKIDDMLGSIEKNKLASLIVWNRNPLNLAAKPIMIMAEGSIIRESE